MGSLHLSFHGPGIYTIWSSFLNLLGQLEPNLAVMMFVRSFTKVLIFSWSGFKKMATMDHSWFWLIETLIIFSEATIPNSLLVCTNNLFEIYYKKFSNSSWYGENMTTMSNTCFWGAETLKYILLNLQIKMICCLVLIMYVKSFIKCFHYVLNW